MKSTIIFVVGFPGSGKSTVATLIAKQLRASHLDKDSVCNTLTGVMLESHGESATARDNSTLYREKIMPAEYHTLMNVASNSLHSSDVVVIDAPFVSFFDDPDYIKKCRQTWHWQDLNLIAIEVFASPEVTRQRIEARGESRDHWKLENWQTFANSLSRQTCQWQDANIIRFDNSASQTDVTNLITRIESLIHR